MTIAADNKIKNRSFALDLLKTISIIAVVLYHLGILQYGYLGVEVFLVISGYNFARRTEYVSIRQDIFPAIRKIFKKEYFLILVFSILSLLVGFFFLFPIYFNTLAYNILGTVFLSTNCIPVLRATDYWNTANMLNPAMHMWYICILMKGQIVLMLLFWAVKKRKPRISNKRIFLVIFIVSLLLNRIPAIPEYCRFYLLPFRLYEIALGGLLFELQKTGKRFPKGKPIVALPFYLLLIGIFVIGQFCTIPKWVLTAVTLIGTAAGIYFDRTVYNPEKPNLLNLSTLLGRNSYPIYIWHQFVIAFSLLFLFEEVNAACVFVVVLATAALSVLTYYLSKTKAIQKIKSNVALMLAVVIAVSGFSALAYAKKGVFFDHPELGITAEYPDPDDRITYVDIPYRWNTGFRDDSKLHVLVMGNSFGRDFANVLSESEMNDKIEINYLEYQVDRIPLNDEMKKKIDRADVVFYSSDLWVESEELENYCYDKLLVVGNKCFSTNTKVWLKRNNPDYFQQVYTVPTDFLDENKKFREKFGEHYIDMMECTMIDDTHQRIFTDDNYYISIDGHHLSRQGAKYYARKMDIAEILGRAENFKKQ